MARNPCETGIPDSCAAILREIKSIEIEIKRLQAELRVAAPQEKPQLVVDIRERSTEKRGRQEAFAACAGNPTPVESTFDGTATIAFSDPQVPRQTAPMSAAVFFNAQRDTMILPRMDSIVSDPFDTGILGTNVTTVSLQRPATGSILAGCNLAVRLLLRFDHSIDLPLFEEDSDLDVLVSTLAAGGSAVDTSGTFHPIP